MGGAEKEQLQAAIKTANAGLRNTIITCTVTISIFMGGVIFQLGKWREQSEVTYLWKQEAAPVIAQHTTDIAVLKSKIR